MKFGKIIRPGMMNPNVLKNEINADIFPLDSAVKIADENILKPEKRKLNANIRNPLFVISYTSSFLPVNSCTKLLAPSKDRAKRCV